MKQTTEPPFQKKLKTNEEKKKELKKIISKEKKSIIIKYIFRNTSRNEILEKSLNIKHIYYNYTERHNG